MNVCVYVCRYVSTYLIYIYIYIYICTRIHIQIEYKHKGRGRHRFRFRYRNGMRIGIAPETDIVERYNPKPEGALNP